MSSQTFNCIIVDDEPIARSIVEGYVSQMLNINCVGQFKNAVEAILFIENCDESLIIFLDINMPNLNGLSMAKILNPKHQVIFTTAYTEYAVESYEYNAVDYLLKPFKFDRFAKAVLKAIKRLKNSNNDSSIKEQTSIKSNIYIKSGSENFLIDLNELAYCEAKKNYTKLFMLDDSTFNTLIPISKFEEQLNTASNLFLRIHRSYIISRKHIASIGSNYVTIAGNKIPIGPQYRETFFEEFNVKK